MASSLTKEEEEEEEEKEEDMKSLFEGMVLFNHSQVAAEAKDQEQHKHHHQSINPTPQTDDASASSLSSSLSIPLDENLFSDLTLITPLQTLKDEGLQPHQSDPSSPGPSSATSTTVSASIATTATSITSSSTTVSTTTREAPYLPSYVSRQTSSRKKKRGSLRIGYGRDTAQIPDDDLRSVEPELPRSSSVAEIISDEAAAGKEDIEEETQQQHREEEEAASCSTPDSHPPRTTISVENDFSDNSFQAVDSSPGSIRIDNAVFRLDHLVPEAGPTSLLGEAVREEKHKEVVTATSGPIELRFGQIRSQISEKLKRAREVVSSVSAARKNATRRRRNAVSNLGLVSTKYRQLEKELEDACEVEDFETAERVSLSLASAEKEKELLAIALRDAEAECDAIDSKMQEVLVSQISVEEECASLLQTFSKDAGIGADFVLENVKIMSSKEMDKWFTSTEALEVKKMEVEIESHLINEARLVLNEAIEQSVKYDRREGELLCKREEILTGELEKLLALVKEKEVEISENNANIEKVEKRIADVVSSFQEVLSSIDMTYNNLQLDLSRMKWDGEALSTKKKKIDDFLSQEQGRGRKIRELARISADEANMYEEVVGLRKSLVQFILNSREDKVMLARTEEKLSEDVQMLKQEVSAARTSLQELSSTKSSIQQEIESFKQKILFIDKRVPELEAEKKVSATARNFKEAARIASEAKTLCVEKEGIQLKMERAMLELGKLEEEICDTVNRLQEIEVQISSKEKEFAMARFQRLLLIAGAATAQISAASESGDLEEADILLAEAKAVDSEARKLQSLYNFKEEEYAKLPKHFVSMELVSSLGGKQLAELATYAHIPAL